MFMIVPEARAANSEEPDVKVCEEIRSRVRKACSRCRAKKVRCNGQLPCARCERDYVVCRIERGPLDRELSKSYIATLERQQLSFLKAVRDLQNRYPNDSKVASILQQLQAGGFDTGPLNSPIEPSQAITTTEKIPIWSAIAVDSLSNINNSSIDCSRPAVDVLYQETMLSQDGTMDPQTMFYAGSLLNTDMHSSMQGDLHSEGQQAFQPDPFLSSLHPVLKVPQTFMTQTTHRG